ncbi:MAG TPA: NAD-dependent epimerase/dehydratase family protein [Mycobacteriales bacterium]|nr:NAD-dependent epimerase/dehydratase family protein [Mycobacteriales bacterium]
MTRRAVVLGAGGFLGSHLCRHLLEQGWAVTGLVRDTSAPHVVRRLSGFADELRLVEGPAGDEDVLRQLLPGADAVFPLAGRSGAAQSMSTPLLDLAANGGAQLAMLEAMRRYAPEARSVFPGSRLQYGRVLELPVREDTPVAPVSVYGVHKALGETYHLLYSRVYGLGTCSLRISNAYGPGQDRSDEAFGVVGTFLATAARGKTIRLYGGGHQLRDYVYVKDLCALLETAVIAPGAVGEVFNVGGPRATSLREMAQEVLDVVGAGELADAPWPPEAEAIETGDYVTDISKVATVLGWRPRTSLRDGLTATWAELQTLIAVAG